MQPANQQIRSDSTVTVLQTHIPFEHTIYNSSPELVTINVRSTTVMIVHYNPNLNNAENILKLKNENLSQ